MAKGDFAAMFESPSDSDNGRQQVRLEAGQQVEGTILAISGGLIIVDIGSTADATLDFNEITDRVVQVGDKLRATVKNPRRDGPELTLALGRGGTAVSTAALQLALEGGTPVTGTVTESNKGGFSVELAGIRAFCPISQIDASYVNEPDIYIGQTLDFQIMEIREGGRNVVVSRRKLLEDERRQAENEMASNLAPGAIVEGNIKATIRHGAIVDLGGVEGFIPISELSRARIDTAEDVVTVGEDVRLQVLTVERGDKGLSIRLSLKALEEPSESDKKSAPSKDEILEGKVVKHVGNGLIVATAKGDGLVPTRELSLAPGADHRRSYPVDTELRVVVVNRDGSTGRLRFSVGKVAQVEERNNYREFNKSDSSGQATTMGSLGDLMAKQFPDLAKAAQAAPSSKAAPQGQSSGRSQATPSKQKVPANKAIGKKKVPSKADPQNIRRR